MLIFFGGMETDFSLFVFFLPLVEPLPALL
jgi:hypothetical protein